MKSHNYKPILTSDAVYIQKVKCTTEKSAFFDINFNLVVDFFLNLGLSNPFDLVTLKSLDSLELENAVKKSYETIQDNLLWASVDLQRIRNYLSEEDDLIWGDLIFWFGWWWNARYEKCVELYKSWYAPKILFSWNIPHWATESQLPEYQFFYQRATQSDIPNDAIILEQRASNTIENVVYSIDLIKNIWIQITRVILVNLPYTMRRSYYTLKANIDRECEIVRVCAVWKYHKDNRYLSYDGYKFVIYEYIKMYWARLMWHM